MTQHHRLCDKLEARDGTTAYRAIGAAASTDRPERWPPSDRWPQGTPAVTLQQAASYETHRSWGSKTERKTTSLLMLILALGTIALVPTLAHAQSLRIYHLDVEQAEATLFVSPSGNTLLVDSGKNGHGDRLRAVMQAAGVNIHALAGPIQSKSGQTYRVRNASRVYSTDNFTLLRIDPDRVRVQVFGWKGNLLGSKTHRFV